MDAIALGCLTALLVPRLRFSRRGLLMMRAIGAALPARAAALRPSRRYI